MLCGGASKKNGSREGRGRLLHPQCAEVRFLIITEHLTATAAPKSLVRLHVFGCGFLSGRWCGENAARAVSITDRKLAWTACSQISGTACGAAQKSNRMASSLDPRRSRDRGKAL